MVMAPSVLSRREARLDGQEGHFVHEKIFKSLQDSKTPSSESNGREVLVTWLMRIPYGSWGGCEGYSWKTNFHTVFSARQGEFMIYLTANEREPISKFLKRHQPRRNINEEQRFDWESYIADSDRCNGVLGGGGVWCGAEGAVRGYGGRQA